MGIINFFQERDRDRESIIKVDSWRLMICFPLYLLYLFIFFFFVIERFFLKTRKLVINMYIFLLIRNVTIFSLI